MAMDSKRAKEICAAERMANVTHIGVPIYIESVSDDKGTANIHPLSQPDLHQTVNVSSRTGAPKKEKNPAPSGQDRGGMLLRDITDGA